MQKKLLSILLCTALLLSLALLVSAANEAEIAIVLSDSGITVDGTAVSENPVDAVYVGAEIVYYHEGMGSDYGEGTAADAHSRAEADAHTVVTITKAGTYRISGKLSLGQIAVDLGSDASDDPNAVVTLILDGMDITCTVAPAVIFYNVYECGVVDIETATGIVDTSAAGANVILADGSVNTATGSYVARIYKEGTTKKLHKYDGAFYSKMSMNISAQNAGTGVLNIIAANEGLDSELHLTVNGGKIYIQSQDDGVNTNEDFVSVTTINGGYLCINAGLGSEGDGIDSNGFLTINGGTIVSQANQMADGGIDADCDILINGGTVIALGGRNDAVSGASAQPYMELSLASRRQAGTILHIQDADGEALVTFEASRAFQSVTITSPGLKLNTTYHVYMGGTYIGGGQTDGVYSGGTYTGGVQQQYSGNQSMGFGGGMGGMRPDIERPDGFEPGDWGQWNQGEIPEGFNPADREPGQRPQMPNDIELPEGFDPEQWNQGQRLDGAVGGEATEGSPDFILTQSIKTFSGVADWTAVSGKAAVSFSVNGGTGIESVKAGETPVLTAVAATDRTGAAVAIAASQVQLTVTDVPSENYAESCLLSDGLAAMAAILPADQGHYVLTISVLSTNEAYTGTSQFEFRVGGLPFVDINETSPWFEAVVFAHENGLMVGTGNNRFSPNQSVTRAMAVTVLGRLANADTVDGEAFADVQAGSWYAPYVGWAHSSEIVMGYGDGTFGPNDSITRQQMCVILYNYAVSQGISLSSVELSYSDSGDIADWALEAVKACQASGLLDGISTGDALRPTQAISRGELATAMLQLSKLG